MMTFKTLSTAFLIASVLCKSMEAQNTPADLRNQLLGYWYYEEEDSINISLERGTFKHVHKLYFTPDSLLISNFGDTGISSAAASWSCDKGSWSVNEDTIEFKPISAIFFNQGFFSMGESNLDFSYIVKSVDKDSLVIAFKQDGRLSATLHEPSYSRVYKKVSHIEMYDGPPPPYPYSSPKRWKKQ